MINKCRICCEKTKSYINNIEDYEYKIDGKWSYDYCEDCKTYQINPFPDTIEEIKKYYPSDYHKFNKSLFFKALNFLVLNIRAISAKISRNQSLKILDVGAGDVEFLRVIKSKNPKIDCIGLDLSYPANKLNKNIQLINRPFINVNFERNYFDYIFMNNYLEHSLSPLNELQHAFEKLKPNGKLIGILPNFNSFDRFIFGKYWGGMHVPRHLYQFNARSLGMLLEKSGFAKYSIKNEFQPGHISISISNYLISKFKLKGPRIPLFSILTISLTPISIIFAMLNKNGSMKFEATKQ